MSTLHHNPGWTSVILSTIADIRFNEYEEPADIFKKNEQLLQNYNLDGIIYYLDIKEVNEFNADICKRVLHTFRLLLSYLTFTNNTSSIKKDIENNINIFSHAIKTNTHVSII
jgi:hypothetical protein